MAMKQRSMLTRRLRLLVVGALSLLAGVARATTFKVGSGQAYTTIQSAINAAQDFDTVLVAPGTYTENIDLLGKWITVTSSGGAAVTIIDGSAKSAPAVTIESGGTHTALMGSPTFSGFTVQNGGTGKATTPTGGIVVNLSNGLIANNVLTHNHCAGLWVVMLQGPPTVQNNEVDNTTDNYDCPSGGGSGIVVSRSQTGCVNCTNIPVIITGNMIQNNPYGGHEGQGGGGITVLAGTPGAQIQNNTVRFNTTAGIGGGIFSGISDVEMVQNLIYDNQAVCGGAGIAVERTQYTAGTGTLLLANNTLDQDTLTGAACTATQAGNASELLFGDEGSATYPAVVINNILSGSSTQPSVACAFANDAAAGLVDTPVFDHNLFFNSGGPVLDTASCTDPHALLTDLTADPQFVSPATGNFQLTATSPAVDAGNNNALVLDNETGYFTINTTTDFAGNPRLADATGKGYATIDLGTYELTGTADTHQTSVSLTAANVSGEHFLLTALGGSSINLIASVTSPVSGSSGCTGPVSFLEDGVSVGSANIVAFTNVATLKGVFLAPGTHHFVASYGGQSPCSAGASVELLYIVSNYAPALTITSSLNPAPPVQPVTFTVTIASADPAQGGPIYLTDGGTALTTLTPNSAGVATFTTSALAPGMHTIQASYAADTTHFAASASLLQTILSPAPTTTVLTITPPNSVYGTPVTLTAAVAPVTPVAGQTPTGTVSFYYSASLNPLVALLGTVPLSASGTASLTLSALPGGAGTISCSYSGDSAFAPSNCTPATATVTPAATTLTLTSSLNPAPALTAVTFTAHLAVSGGGVPPVGSAVSLSLNSQAIVLTTDANGNATYTTSALVAGQYAVSAGFGGTGDLTASSAALTEVVTLIPTATTLTAAPNPAYAGQAVTLTALATGTSASQPLTGSATFFDGGNALGSASMNGAGVASLTVTTLAVGTHPLTAVYAAGPVFGGSTSPVVQEVVLASGFGVAVVPSVVSIQTGLSTTAAVQLTSLGGFSGPLTLSVGSLPMNMTATIAPASVTLASGGTGASVLTLNTRQMAESVAPRGPGGSRRWPVVLTATVLLALPWSRRRGRRLRGVIAAVGLMGMLQTLSGCTDSYAHVELVATGTYTVVVTATDASQNMQSAALTVVVTQ